MPAAGDPSGFHDKRRVVPNPLTGVRASAATRPLPQSKSRSRSSGRASTNAHSQEWDSVRASLRGMSTHAMSTAEVGLRLFAVINRAPNLLAQVDASTCEGIGGVGGRISPDLLPLPMPNFTVITEKEINIFFPPASSTRVAVSWPTYVAGVGLPGSRGARAQAWLGLQAIMIIKGPKPFVFSQF